MPKEIEPENGNSYLSADLAAASTPEAIALSAREIAQASGLVPGAVGAPPKGFETLEWREGAVLILCYFFNGQWWTVLTRRSENLRNHKGQISLPGGRVEAGEQHGAAALRETFEEVGIIPATVKLRAVLNHVYVPPSRFVVTPFVGLTNEKPLFKPNPDEVSEIIELPLQALLLPGARVEQDRVFQGVTRRMTFYTYLDYEIWGATAQILRQFLNYFPQVLE